MTVTFEAGRCLHAAECVRGLPEVFGSAERPWIRPDGADADRVA
ncbi:(4Fe-4S)-binding protein [Streptomyces sp. NPDC094448]